MNVSFCSVLSTPKVLAWSLENAKSIRRSNKVLFDKVAEVHTISSFYSNQRVRFQHNSLTIFFCPFFFLAASESVTQALIEEKPLNSSWLVLLTTRFNSVHVRGNYRQRINLTISSENKQRLTTCTLIHTAQLCQRPSLFCDLPTGTNHAWQGVLQITRQSIALWYLELPTRQTVLK